MLKNKIYKYLSIEIFKSFLTILLTFTAIAWTVRAVNFLDLMIEDGYSMIIYLKYSMLNISTIITRFIPLSFLLSMIISISKFQSQKELLILWTTGLNKMKVVNIFLLIGLTVVILQIVLSVIVNPLLLNKSRTLLKDTAENQINSMLKTKDFSDAFEGVTFYVNQKKSNNELIGVFINDSSGSLSMIINDANTQSSSTIFAERGFIDGKKIILFSGSIQSLNKKKEIKIINFEKTELNIDNFSTRTIKQPKIQETSSYFLFQCLINKNTSKLRKNCKIDNHVLIEHLSRRIGMPLYIPLVSVITSLLLVQQREKKINFLNNYFLFSFAFVVLIFAEITLKYSGFSLINFIGYFFSPIILLIILYLYLAKKMTIKNI